MELSQDILKGLHELGDAKQVSDASFKDLVEIAFRVLLSKATEEKLQGNHRFIFFLLMFNSASPNLSKMDQILVKQTYSTFISFILEAAKYNTDPIQLK